jgi:integrase
VGRKRKDDSQGLPQRVYLRRGSFFYVHRSGKWENLGHDLAAARRKAEHYADPSGTYGTMTWWLQQFLVEFEHQVRAKLKSERTLKDYQGAIGTADAPGPLRAFFGPMLPAQIEPRHITTYLEVGAKADRGVRANRERACLSSCISWMLRNGHGGISVNPCMRASGVRRNAERARDRYVTDAEYKAVFSEAPAQVRLMMELTYRTLQRPDSDILHWTAATVRRSPEGHRVLAFQQHKTKRQVQIGLTGELGLLVAVAIGDVPVLHQPIVHTRSGDAYTYSGISAMLKRAQAKARQAHKELAGMPSFGFRDLKGKGATDLWLAGEPIERIQLLCGHAKASTTEIYIKARWTQTAAPNDRQIGA